MTREQTQLLAEAAKRGSQGCLPRVPDFESLSDDELLTTINRDLSLLDRLSSYPNGPAFRYLMAEIHTARHVLNARPL